MTAARLKTTDSHSLSHNSVLTQVKQNIGVTDKPGGSTATELAFRCGQVWILTEPESAILYSVFCQL